MPELNYNTGDGLTRVDEPRGVWAAYYSDMSAVAVFGTEVEALRHAVSRSMQVTFWQFGEDLHEADSRRRKGA